MAFDKLLKFFAPKDTIFQPLFEKVAENLTAISKLLVQTISEDDSEKRQIHIVAIKDLEHEGDRLTYELYKNLIDTFITPFDREDIHQLAHTMDDVADYINKTAQRIELYNPKRMVPAYGTIANMILEAAQHIEIAIKELAHVKDPEIVNKACDSIRDIESKTDRLYHATIIEIFRDEKDAVELIKNKEILEALEKTTDKTKNVSKVIKTVLVKMV